MTSCRRLSARDFALRFSVARPRLDVDDADGAAAAGAGDVTRSSVGGGIISTLFEEMSPAVMSRACWLGSEVYS